VSVAIHRTRHGLICHEEQDRTIGAALHTYGEWAEEEIHFLSAFITEGAVILDIGANVGTHALAFSRFAGAGGLVLAIDAQERMHDLFVLSVALNAVDNVRCLRAIVGRETGVRFVAPENHETRDDFGAVSYVDASARNDRGLGFLPLAMIRVDDLSLERCDLLKIDVEGMELDVLLGAEKTIARYRPPIYF
jgi:FkbM family methyltransferase